MSLGLLRRIRRELAVYWQAGDLDHYGRPTWQEPVEITCRWNDTIQVLRTPQGETLTFNGQVTVDREMKMGDRLKKGAMETNTPSDPTTDPDTRIIQKFDATPDVKARHSLLRAYI